MAGLWEWEEAAHYVRYSEEFGTPSKFAEAAALGLPIGENVTRLLDIGCGTGIVGLYCLAKRAAAFVTFNDIQPDAIRETAINAATLIERGRISPSQMSLTASIGFDHLGVELVRQHDLISFNPPQLPTQHLYKDVLAKLETDPHKAIFRIAGPDGLALAKRFFAWYARMPKPKPRAVIVLSSFLGWSRILEQIHAHGLKEDVLRTVTIPLRKWLVGAADGFAGDPLELRDRLLTKTDGGWNKTLFVVALESA